MAGQARLEGIDSGLNAQPGRHIRLTARRSGVHPERCRKEEHSNAQQQEPAVSAFHCYLSAISMIEI
jgi:hypothetical protein